MENLTPQQRAQLEVNQVHTYASGTPPKPFVVCLFVFFSRLKFKDFIATYNHVTQNCFEDCVRDFTSRRVTKEEVYTPVRSVLDNPLSPQIACCDHCVDKYVKMTQRLSLRLQEHYQLQNQVDPSHQQPHTR